MPLILPEPESQFLDGNGDPYAGGTIDTYIPGTDTRKNTWQDHDGTVLNTNPIVLDAAGRAIIFGDGDYRFVLKDADGNLIYDQFTSVIDTSSFATAADVAAAVQVETDRATAAETTLTNNLNAEIARAEAAEAHLQSEIDGASGAAGGILPAGYSMRFGTGVSDSAGNFSGTFSPPFPTACDSITTAAGHHVWAGINSVSASGFTGLTSSPLFGGTWGGGPQGYYWIAIGH